MTSAVLDARTTLTRAHGSNGESVVLNLYGLLFMGLPGPSLHALFTYENSTNLSFDNSAFYHLQATIGSIEKRTIGPDNNLALYQLRGNIIWLIPAKEQYTRCYGHLPTVSVAGPVTCCDGSRHPLNPNAHHRPPGFHGLTDTKAFFPVPLNLGFYIFFTGTLRRLRPDERQLNEEFIVIVDTFDFCEGIRPSPHATSHFTFHQDRERPDELTLT